MNNDTILKEIVDYRDALLNPAKYFATSNSDDVFKTTTSLIKLLSQSIPKFSRSYSSPLLTNMSEVQPFGLKEKHYQSFVLLILRYLNQLPSDKFTLQQWEDICDVCSNISI